MSKLSILLLCIGICFLVAMPGLVIFYVFSEEILRFVGENTLRGMLVTFSMAVAGLLFTVAVVWAVHQINNYFR